MNGPVEQIVALEPGHPPLRYYTNGENQLLRIMSAANELFDHAGLVNMRFLPHGSHSFTLNAPAHESLDRLPSFELERFFKSFSPELSETITAVRLRLNDYIARLGIGLVSVSVQPINGAGTIVLPLTDMKAPTIGNVLSPMPLRAQVLAGFKIDEGAELFNANGVIHGRTFSFGEGFTSFRAPTPEPKRLSGRLIVTEGSTLGVSVPVVDLPTFENAGLPYREVTPAPREIDTPTDGRYDASQLYTCRYLTQDAVRKAFRGEM